MQLSRVSDFVVSFQPLRNGSDPSGAARPTPQPWRSEIYLCPFQLQARSHTPPALSVRDMDGGRRQRGQQDDAIPLTHTDEEDYELYLASESIDDGEDLHDAAHGHTRLVPFPARATGLSKKLTVSPRAPYRFTRYPARASVNILGPLFVLAYFLFVIYEYLQRPAVNDVAPLRPIGAKSVFFFWSS